MGRPSNRAARRREIARAFERVLAKHGQSGATIAAIAAEANVAPGLLHHHFSGKQDLYGELLASLLGRFRARADQDPGKSSLADYVDAAVGLGPGADPDAARAWVGLFAEAVSDPILFQKLRRVMDAEIAGLQRRAKGELSEEQASAVLAFVIGTLVFGAFAPRKVTGFAAPALHTFVRALRAQPP